MTKRGKGKQHKFKKSKTNSSGGGEAGPGGKGPGKKAATGPSTGGKSSPRRRREDGASPTRETSGQNGRGQGGTSGPRRGGGRGGPTHGGKAISDSRDESGGWLGGPQLERARAETKSKLTEWLAAGIAMRQEQVVNAAKALAGAADAATVKMQLDPWQQEVFDLLVEGKSVIVDAPTTAGKTRAVEAFFRANINNPQFRAAYTTPVKSLSNDKLREFRAMFGSENVGIATGDIKENLGAKLVVATLESYRNSLLGVEPDLGRTLVVFDEYHYLQDESRGSAWEEALILTPASCQVLLLSASVANAEEFASWLSQIHPGRQCLLVRTETRPVPLKPLVYFGRDWLLPETLPGGGLKNLEKSRLEIPLRQDELAVRAAALLPLGLTPAIIYCGRRLACETMALLLMRHLEPLPEADSAKIGESLQLSHTECKALLFINPKLRHMLQVYGIAYHHSGLAAPARMAIEALVKQGLLRFCTATMGLSLGINFSVRAALISDYQRPGELGFTDYAPSEVLQMLGRAGRRGKDTVGFSLWATPEAMSRLGKAKRDSVDSRLRNDPTTFLGLIGRGFSLRAIENFYSLSFRRFQDQNIDLSLITKSRLQKKFEGAVLPCVSPAAEVGRFWAENPDSLCRRCELRERCHTILAAKSEGSLAAMHLHLHHIAALERDESLTEFGRLARFFPQAGGMVMARLIADGKITAENLPKAAELAAAMTLARFKEPGADPRYRLPFNISEIEDSLAEMYPIELFAELYDPPFKQRDYPVIREFNPAAGFVVREWIQGMEWKELALTVTHEQYGTGDMMSLLYRTATYLQSMIQAGIPSLAADARTLRDVMLREPLSYLLEI